MSEKGEGYQGWKEEKRKRKERMGDGYEKMKGARGENNACVGSSIQSLMITSKAGGGH